MLMVATEIVIVEVMQTSDGTLGPVSLAVHTVNFVDISMEIEDVLN